MSAQIRQLEQEYGDRLLDRSGKTVKLTPAGQIFYEYALRLKSLRDESLVAVADHGQTPRGTLMVGANEATCLYVLPEVFGEYCRHYPDVQISIYRNFTYKIVEKLENGSLDVGVLSLPIQSPSLKIQPIFRDRLMLMVSPKNPLAKLKSAHVSEVVKYPLLLPKTGHTRRLLDKLFREYNSELKVRMELPSIGMIKSFVAADLGISLISTSFAPRPYSFRRGQSLYHRLAATCHSSQENGCAGERLASKRLSDFAPSDSEARSQAVAAPESSNSSGF